MTSTEVSGVLILWRIGYTVPPHHPYPERILQADHVSKGEKHHDLVLYGCRLFIPTTNMQKDPCSPSFGSPRSSLDKAKSIPNPLLDSNIENIITCTSCKQCQDYLPSNHKEPLQAKVRLLQPFQEAAMDFCYYAWRS